MPKSNPFTSNIFRLATLACSHLVVDMYGSILPGILPVALAHFRINLGLAIYVMTTVAVGCNLLQLPVARLDRTRTTPRLLVLGVILASFITLLGVLPSTTPVWLLCCLMLVVSTGVALVHPFGLRGIQNLTDLPPTISTPAFMSGGFLGAFLGPLLSAILVERMGLRGLRWLLVPMVVLVAAQMAARLRLAPDSTPANASKDNASQDTAYLPECPWSFAGLFLIATFINIGSTIFNQLLPTTLHDIHGFNLTFGGASLTAFGLGCAIGSLGLGTLARKYPPKWFILGGMVVGVPATALYCFLLGNTWAAPLVFLAGVSATSGYPLLVALAKSAKNGPALSTRIALLVGGTWGIAGIVFLGVGQLAHHCLGLERVMHVSWICYALALLTALLMMQRTPKRQLPQ